MFKTFWAALLGYLNARTHPANSKPSHKVLLPCPPCICRLAVAGVTQTQVPVVRDTTVSHSSQVRKAEKSFPAPGEVCSWCISSAWPRLSMREKAECFQRCNYDPEVSLDRRRCFHEMQPNGVEMPCVSFSFTNCLAFRLKASWSCSLNLSLPICKVGRTVSSVYFVGSRCYLCSRVYPRHVLTGSSTPSTLLEKLANRTLALFLWDLDSHWVRKGETRREDK